MVGPFDERQPRVGAVEMIEQSQGAGFVAIGFEHSIANLFFLPYGWMLDTGAAVSGAGIARNLIAVTAGNIVGGAKGPGGQILGIVKEIRERLEDGKTIEKIA